MNASFLRIGKSNNAEITIKNIYDFCKINEWHRTDDELCCVRFDKVFQK